MAVEKTHRIFVSYSSANKEFVLGLAKELKTPGFPIWFDQLDIPTGARWDEEVEKALHECEMFMLILSPASMASENVKDEIEYAIDHGKRILPVLFESCDIPLRLRRLQYVDFTRLSHAEGVSEAKRLLTDLTTEKSMLILEQKDTISTTGDETGPLNFFDREGSRPGNHVEVEIIHEGDKLYSRHSRNIYVSYSRNNGGIVAGLVKELKKSRLPIWLDQLDVAPGKRKDEEVEKALHECGAFMVILTPDAIFSEKVKDEIGYAIDHGKHILPVLMKSCEIPLRLRRFQGVDFTKLGDAEGIKSTKKYLRTLMTDESMWVLEEIDDMAENGGDLIKHLLPVGDYAYSQREMEVKGDRKHIVIGHGHSLVWKDLQDFIQDRLRLPWDEFNHVLVEDAADIFRLSKMLDRAAMAFLIVTAEDEQGDVGLKTQLNIVHEAGLFQGRLGFTRTIVLLEDGCKEFSNILGLKQIKFPKGSIKATFEEIREVLEREDIIAS